MGFLHKSDSRISKAGINIYKLLKIKFVKLKKSTTVHIRSDKGFRRLSQALLFLHVGSIQITITIPLIPSLSVA